MAQTHPIKVSKSAFGSTSDGQKVDLYTLSNQHGMEVRILNYGGIIVSLRVPDKDGKIEDVVLGYETMDGYIERPSFFGALVGRYANRIGGASFQLNGATYTLAANNGKNHIHGGSQGFDKVIWDAKIIDNGAIGGIELSYLSKDMEEGYPGNLSVKVKYLLDNDNQFHLLFSGETDKSTIVNLTQHTYFNLSGNTKRDILEHELMMNASGFVVVDRELIPTGEIRPVEGGPFDFTSPKTIGSRISEENDQLIVGNGYDHTFVLDKEGRDGPELAVRVKDPDSGRILELLTTEPGFQFYTSNFLDGTITGKYGAVYGPRYGFCLEQGHFPDSPNQPGFPSVVLNPEETYNSETIWRFSVGD